MKAERWQAVRKVLEEALDLPLAERLAYVDQVCGDDGDLRREVVSMIASYEEEGDALESPVMDLEGVLSAGMVGGETLTEAQRQVGAYHLIEQIGQGGMGAVFLARRSDRAYQKKVAVKLLRPGWTSEDLLRRFRRERQILANLEHPNITKLLDGGTTEDGRPYLVMEYVDGLPVDVYCRRKGLHVEQRLEIFLQILDAIQIAHANLIVHRDLKPGNILVTEEGEPKLLDFGIAKILQPASFQQTVLPTRTGLMPMTLEYASPEQVLGKTVTTAADVYALGVLLFELLTGERPYEFAEGGLDSIVEVVCHQEPRKPSTVVLTTSSRPQAKDWDARGVSRRLSGDLDAIVLHALRKEPAARYSSVARFADDLRRHLSGHPVAARRDTFWYHTTKFVRRHRLAVGGTILTFLVLLGFIVVLLGQQSRNLEQSRQTERERNRAEAVSGWLLELFELPAPSRARGEKVTARELLDKGAKTITEDLSSSPLLQAELMGTMGRTYAQLGLYREGIALLQRSITLHRRITEPDLETLVFHLQELSEALTATGEYRRAQVLGREALALSQRVQTKDTLAQAEAMALLGHLRDLMGDHEAAEPMLSEALVLVRQGGDPAALAKVLEYAAEAARRRDEIEDARAMYKEALMMLGEHHGKQHPEVALIKSSLADVEKYWDPDAAELLFREAIASQREIFKGAHGVLATALNNFGFLLYEGGRYDEAESYFKEALEMQTELYGEKHRKVAASLNNLASVEARRGNIGGAEGLNRQALAIYAEHLGENHPEYAKQLSNLGSLVLRQGRIEEGKDLFDRALAITEDVLGSHHHERVATLLGRGQVDYRRGDMAAAQEFFAEAVDIAYESLGERHPELAKALLLLGMAFQEGGRLELGVERLEEALAVEARDGATSRLSFEIETRLADLYLELSRWEDAEASARHAFEALSEEEAGEGDLWTLWAQSLLGRSLLHLRRYDEAESLLVDRLAKLEANQAPGSSRLRGAVEHVIELYEATGDAENQEHYRKKLAALQEPSGSR